MIELADVPELTDPVMISAFDGWSDAGLAASAAVDHLAEVWHATPVLEIEPDDFYDFQVSRPELTVDDSGSRRLVWPTTRFSYARLPSGRDLVLARGPEPNMRWREFCAEFMSACHELGVERIVMLGAAPEETPHTRPVPVSATTPDPGLARSLGLPPTTYQGPVGIVTVLQEICFHAGLPAVTFWAKVPFYVAQTESPKAALALLRKVEDVLDVAIPLRDLPERARSWQQWADELTAQEDELGELVKTMEDQQATAELPEASGDAIAREFERYLLRQEHERPDGPSPA